MKFYRAAPLNAIPAGQGDPGGAGPGAPVELGGAAIAIRLADLVSPAGLAAKAGRTALVVAGTPRIRTGEQLVFVKVAAAAPAVVRRDGKVQAGGHPADHARLGALEQQLDELAGPGVIDEIAAEATLEGKVKGKARRSMTAAAAIRATVLMALMPDADYAGVLAAVFGDLVLVPWQRPFRVPTRRCWAPGGQPWVPRRWPGCRPGCWPPSAASTATAITGPSASASCAWARSTGP